MAIRRKLKIGWKDRLWLKLGILFFILSFLIIGQVSYNEYKQCSPDWQSMCGFAIGIFNLPVSAFFINNPLLSHFFDSIPKYASITALVILSSIFWFIVGVLIGSIIQKAKSKK